MGIEADQLLAGTAGKGVTGGKRFVGGHSSQAAKNRAHELVKKFDLGAGQWGDNILSNLSQPKSDEVDAESTTVDVMIERLNKEMIQAAERLEFEKPSQLRDRILQLENSKTN